MQVVGPSPFLPFVSRPSSAVVRAETPAPPAVTPDAEAAGTTRAVAPPQVLPVVVGLLRSAVRVGSPVLPALRPDVGVSGLRAVEVEPPPGTNLALWSVLTTDEREFFAQQAQLGPLQYGPGGSAPLLPTAPRGQRIDTLA
jgi:hypothetical protein